MLVDGKWSRNWQPAQATDGKGGFVRETSSFRDFVTPNGAPGATGEGGFLAQAGRYLYAALICPWASRALIARRLKRVLDFPGLRETVSIDPIKRGYYSIKALNPNGIVPLGPDLSSLGL